MPIKLLIFNWRDIKNPAGGGAEVYTHQISKRLVVKGHEVTLFTSSFDGALEEEIIDGVRIVRAGNRFSVYRKAKEFYKRSTSTWDIVVDEINTVPFMTPRFVGPDVKLVALIHQLAREFWYYEMPYPMAWMGHHYFENKWLSAYTNIPTITVSDSTRKELQELGFSRLHIVPNGLNVKVLGAVPPKTAEPTMVFVGRMKKAKRPNDVIAAYHLLKTKWPNLKLTMVGDGYMRAPLQKDNPDVEFLGYVDRATRDELVQRSWVIAVPGVREGWGQVVTDANALGTPAVGYDIPGLRDSIRNDHNGLLVHPDPMHLSDGIERVISDGALRARLSDNALEWAQGFDWEKSANEFERFLHGL